MDDMAEGVPTRSVYRLAHLSDLHIAPLPRARARDLIGKRLLGYLSWRRRRHREHRPELLDALVDDLRTLRPDHVAITGDLVNIALPEEFRQAAAWLHELGDPGWVSVVPGNHDAYVRVDPRDSLDHWAAYMASDEDLEGLSAGFPFLRLRGPLALIGLSTAVATPPTRATGRLGEAQLLALDALLARLAGSGRCRVILLHHSPLARISRPRKRLVDAAAFCAVIARHGAELVLHGHEHVSLEGRIAGKEDSVPVFGAACASMLDHRAERGAQYRVHGIERAARGFRLHVETRRFDAASGRFQPVQSELLKPTPAAQPFPTSARQSGPEPMP